MALSNPGLFLYGYTIDSTNALLDFQAVSLGPQITASLTYGYYSLTTLLDEVARAMNAADTDNVYTATADRSLSGGVQNRVTIATDGAFLSLLSHTGTNGGPWTTLGFTTASDKTGATTYTGSATTGTGFQPVYIPYNFLSPDQIQLPTAITNISTSGNKETVIYSIQKFWQMQCKYISAYEKTLNFEPMLQWLMQGRLVEYTPDVASSTTFYEGWMESNPGAQNGLGYFLKEMLPDFPNVYDTGLLKFRVRPTS